jgi:hypothetical protein
MTGSYFKNEINRQDARVRGLKKLLFLTKPQTGLIVCPDERAKRVGLPLRPAALASVLSATLAPWRFKIISVFGRFGEF